MIAFNRSQLLNFILALTVDDRIMLTAINLNFRVAESLLFPVISEQSASIFDLLGPGHELIIQPLFLLAEMCIQPEISDIVNSLN